MDNKIVKDILEEIKKADKIIILRHVIPDGDAYGFQFGLKKLIELNWPNKIVKITGQKNPKLDFIGDKFDEIKDEEFKESLVIVGDTANTPRIDDQRWNLGRKVIKIDHHPNREPYGDLILVCDDYCAASEILADIVMTNKLKCDAEIARIIYHGIVTDSMRFLLRYPKPRTLRLAAFLLDFGFDLQKLYETMYERNDDEIRFVSYVYQNYKRTKNGVAYLMLDKETLKKLKVSADYAAYDNVSLLANIKDTPIWAFFCEYDDKKEIRVELRSMNITINDIAEKHGGGGHKTSAGIKIKSFDEAEQIVKELENKLTK